MHAATNILNVFQIAFNLDVFNICYIFYGNVLSE